MPLLGQSLVSQSSCQQRALWSWIAPRKRGAGRMTLNGPIDSLDGELLCSSTFRWENPGNNASLELISPLQTIICLAHHRRKGQNGRNSASETTQSPWCFCLRIRKNASMMIIVSAYSCVARPLVPVHVPPLRYDMTFFVPMLTCRWRVTK